MFRQFGSRIGTIWCNVTHESLMWPVHGHYKCRTCGRRYPAFTEAPMVNWTKRTAFKPAVPLLLALALATFAQPAHATDVVKGHSPAEVRSFDRWRRGSIAALEQFTSLTGTDARETEGGQQ